MYFQVVPLTGPKTLAIDSFTYANKQQLPVHIGQIVTVPFGKKKIKGVVISTVFPQESRFSIKNIAEILLAGQAVVLPWQIAVAKVLAEKYFTSLNKTLKLFLPTKIYSRKKEKEFIFKPVSLNLKLSQFSLNEEQLAVLKKIKQSTQNKFLLHGVTGSGKTEIFLEVISQQLQQGKTAIFLVPEISLTPQMVERFTARFPNLVSCLHSKLTDIQREKEFWRIKQGITKVVIGSRSALFSPISNLGIIVIDEEHDQSYQQQQNPMYDAREVAEIIIQKHDASLLLASGTPSLKSYYRVQQKELVLLNLNRRISEHKVEIKIIDLKNELIKGNKSDFSDLLISSIEEKLAKKEQVLLFLNQRGTAKTVICGDCGQVLKCPHCEISYTYHRLKDGNYLVCHLCGKVMHMPTNCPQCQSFRWNFLRSGTQQIETSIKKRFPQARVIRVDHDTTKKETNFITLYQQIKNQEVDIIIGTQMISKGHDFPNLTLVGVILADVGLYFPSYKAGENLYQLLTQVAGRSGRADKPGQVIIQTYSPDNQIIKQISTENYRGFYQREIIARKQFNYPPFSQMITILHFGKKKDKVLADLKKFKIEDLAEYDVQWPSPALTPKINNIYYFQVVLKVEKIEIELAELLKKINLKANYKLQL